MRANSTTRKSRFGIWLGFGLVLLVVLSGYSSFGQAEQFIQAARNDPERGRAECWPAGVPVGALPGQPESMFCKTLTGGQDTAVRSGNSWLDEFEHGLSFANFEGTSYKVYDIPNGQSGSSIHWLHNNHWMVDIARRSQETPAWYNINTGSLMRPDRSFKFENGRLVVEVDAAASVDGYGNEAWPEIDISTADHPAGASGAYGYDLFGGYWALGCRLQPNRYPTCTLMDDSGDPTAREPSSRVWEISWFQQAGNSSYGGFPLGELAGAWLACKNEDPDTMCRNRYRLEITRTSLLLYVNGVRYFEQTGLPPLPDQLVKGDVYVYFASMIGSHSSDLIRYHWDRIAINPDTPPSAIPGASDH